jgi:flagellar basal body rod protein FlgG
MRAARERSRRVDCSSESKGTHSVFQRITRGGAARKCRTRRIATEKCRSNRPALLNSSYLDLNFYWPLACNCLIAMDPIAAIAASGLRARMESLELLANNVANASTGGYKADREFYSLYTAPEAQDSTTMPLIERPWIDLSQGTVHETGNPLDLALTGKGFFAVDGPTGPLYTRNGNFRLASDGKLITSDGYSVRGTGAPFRVDASRPIDISADGTIRQNGLVVGKLEVVDFSSTAGLSKQGNNYLRVADPNLKPSAPKGASVEQGQLEASNTGSAESAVRLVNVMRQFEMLQKAAQLGNDMSRQAIEQVARVGS